MNFLEEIARTDFHELLLRGKKPKIHFVINSGNRTTTVFLLQEGFSWPFGVLRISHRTKHIEREFDILKIIAKYNNGYFLKTVPYPYNLHSFGKLKVSSFSYIRGDPMIPGIKRRLCVEDHFRRMREWLTVLADIPVPDFLIEQTTYYEFSLRCDYVLENIKNPDDSLIGVLEQVKSIERMLKEKNISLIISHTDLHWSNILLIENRIGVVDWETVMAWRPLEGWFYFIFSYAEGLFSPEKKSPEFRCGVLREMLFKKSWLSQAVLLQTLNLMKDLSLDERLIYEFYFLGMFNYLYCKFWHCLSVFNNAAFLFERKGNILYESIRGL